MSRAFLIGAGATRAEYPGAPLSDDFLKLLGGRNPALYQRIKESVIPHIGGEKQLYDANIEDLMDISYKFPKEVQNTLLDSVHSAIYELLADTTQSDVAYIHNYINGNVIREPSLFKTLLLDGRLNKDDFFMTLNYDLYLDREVLLINNGRIDYGIRDEFKLFDNDISLRLLPDQIFSVYHLHGSLNWQLTGDKITVLRGAIRPKYTRDGSSVCIVPPGRKELNPSLKSIWDVAESRLKNADELIIIGCSLNPDDIELIDLLKKGPDRIKVINWDKRLSQATAIEEENAVNRNLGKRYRAYHHGFRLHPLSGGQRAFDFIFS
ncbi:MAG: hypothetical protein WC980_08670 [Candidatus Brocadiia bacterium]